MTLLISVWTKYISEHENLPKIKKNTTKYSIDKGTLYQEDIKILNVYILNKSFDINEAKADKIERINGKIYNYNRKCQYLFLNNQCNN